MKHACKGLSWEACLFLLSFGILISLVTRNCGPHKGKRILLTFIGNLTQEFWIMLYCVQHQDSSYPFHTFCVELLRIIPFTWNEKLSRIRYGMVERKLKLMNAVFFQGTLARADLEQCLRSFFPLKDDESVEALMKACEQEAPGESVQYKNLFTEVRRKNNTRLFHVWHV